MGKGSSSLWLHSTEQSAHKCCIKSAASERSEGLPQCELGFNAAEPHGWKHSVEKTKQILKNRQNCFTGQVGLENRAAEEESENQLTEGGNPSRQLMSAAGNMPQNADRFNANMPGASNAHY